MCHLQIIASHMRLLFKVQLFTFTKNFAKLYKWLLKGFLELKEEETKLRDENDQLKTKISGMETELEKLEDYEKMLQTKNCLEVKLQNAEKELEEQKILAAKRWNKVDDAEDLRQENKFLENKVRTQQTKLEELEVKVSREVTYTGEVKVRLQDANTGQGQESTIIGHIYV